MFAFCGKLDISAGTDLVEFSGAVGQREGWSHHDEAVVEHQTSLSQLLPADTTSFSSVASSAPQSSMSLPSHISSALKSQIKALPLIIFSFVLAF